MSLLLFSGFRKNKNFSNEHKNKRKENDKIVAKETTDKEQKVSSFALENGMIRNTCRSVLHRQCRDQGLSQDPRSAHPKFLAL